MKLLNLLCNGLNNLSLSFFPTARSSLHIKLRITTAFLFTLDKASTVLNTIERTHQGKKNRPQEVFTFCDHYNAASHVIFCGKAKILKMD